MPPHAPEYPYATYTAPTAVDALRSLVRVLGPESARQAWGEAVRAAGVARVSDDLSAAELARVAAHLVAQPDAVGALGRALQIRVDTFQRLKARGSAAARPEPQTAADAGPPETRR